MAQLAAKGTYVKLGVNVWYDKKQDSIHITSQDKDLGPNGMHMTAKKGTQSDKNLRSLLDMHGCGEHTLGKGPLSEEVQSFADELAAGKFDADLDLLQSLVVARHAQA